MCSADSIIRTSKLTKYYGKRLGIEDVNLEVLRGEIFGYLGPNGAGKTTTIRTLLDFLRPTRGTASIFGMDSKKDSVAVHRRVGYLPGDLELYGNMTGHDLLKYLGNLRGELDWKYVDTLATRFECELPRKIKTLSQGNKRKIGLLQAFMNKPELIILDEPTNGLDPLMQHEFYHLIEETKNEGRSVFLSSHILPEVERVCDRVGIIRQGRLVTVETISALKGKTMRRMEIHFARPISGDSFSGIPGVTDITVQGDLLKCGVTGSLDALVKAAAKFEVIDIVSRDASLEEVFMAFYGYS